MTSSRYAHSTVGLATTVTAGPVLPASGLAASVISACRTCSTPAAPAGTESPHSHAALAPARRLRYPACWPWSSPVHFGLGGPCGTYHGSTPFCRRYDTRPSSVRARPGTLLLTHHMECLQDSPRGETSAAVELTVGSCTLSMARSIGRLWHEPAGTTKVTCTARFAVTSRTPAAAPAKGL